MTPPLVSRKGKRDRDAEWLREMSKIANALMPEESKRMRRIARRLESSRPLRPRDRKDLALGRLVRGMPDGFYVCGEVKKAGEHAGVMEFYSMGGNLEAALRSALSSKRGGRGTDKTKKGRGK